MNEYELHKQIQPALAGECLKRSNCCERNTQVCKQCSRRKLNEVKQPTREKRVHTQAIRRKNTYINP